MEKRVISTELFEEENRTGKQPSPETAERLYRTGESEGKIKNLY